MRSGWDLGIWHHTPREGYRRGGYRCVLSWLATFRLSVGCNYDHENPCSRDHRKDRYRCRSRERSPPAEPGGRFHATKCAVAGPNDSAAPARCRLAARGGGTRGRDGWPWLVHRVTGGSHNSQGLRVCRRRAGAGRGDARGDCRRCSLRYRPPLDCRRCPTGAVGSPPVRSRRRNTSTRRTSGFGGRRNVA